MFINYCYDWMYFLFTSLLCVRQQARYSCISCSILKHFFMGHFLCSVTALLIGYALVQNKKFLKYIVSVLSVWKRERQYEYIHEHLFYPMSFPLFFHGWRFSFSTQILFESITYCGLSWADVKGLPPCPQTLPSSIPNVRLTVLPLHTSWCFSTYICFLEFCVLTD